MGIGLLIVLGLAVAGAIAYFNYKRRQARIAGVAALGKRIGFTFNEDDVGRVVSMPFSLFERGDGRAVELVLSGTHNGAPLQLFDYWYYDETYDNNTHTTSRNYSRFTCGILTLSAACPHLRLGHEGFFSRLGEHVGVHDVQFESDDFNRHFRVKCDDQKFAFCLVDGGMMEWLASADGFEAVEVVGPWVLYAGSQLDPAQWLDIGNWLDGFRNHVPQVLYSEYPPR
ncbi:MAG TPA: hypothetical protein VL856_04615 [Acidimicrobiia bacterium]|nr:hypothetical protein [Acidimicrobiia bacterium]